MITEPDTKGSVFFDVNRLKLCALGRAEIDMLGDSMENTIIGVLGAAAGLIGLVMFVRTLIFRISGTETVGRVVSARKDAKGRFVHKVAYQVGGSEVTGEDTESYDRPLSSGAELPLIYKKSDPECCRSMHEIKLSLAGFGILALLGAAFVVRFLIV